MSTTVKQLRMLFQTAEGRTSAVSLRDPVENPDAGAIEATMDHIVNNELIVTNSGLLTAKIRAEVVERTVDTVFDPS